MTTTSAVDPYAAINGTATSGTSSSDASSDRFLTLLVTQLQNQDPLNPMDNAEITSQMAQINTVNQLQTLNTSVGSLSSQLVQMQALQSASLVGRQVTVEGNHVSFDENGNGAGGFELSGAADNVKVEVLDASGRVADTLQLGAQTAGMHAFEWTPPAGTSGAYTFRVSATSGAASVSTVSLMRDTVEAVSAGASGLTLELATLGDTAYSAVKAFN